MRVLITGAAGFLGRHLTVALAGRDIDDLVLVDRTAVAAPPGTTSRTLDLADPTAVDALEVGAFDSIFHLAATLTADAERDMAGALAVNVSPLMRMLEAARAAKAPPKFVFASSIAVYGGALLARVDETVRHTPTTSYGVHKAMAELLINDYSRHGVIDGRSLRLPIVVTRTQAAASPSVSDKVAAIIREPLMGGDVVVPFARDVSLPIVSAQRVAAGLLAIHDAPAGVFGASRAVNLPALTARVGDIIAAVERRGAGGRITVDPDPAVAAIVAGWPQVFASTIADKIGIAGDRDIDEVIDLFLADAGRR